MSRKKRDFKIRKMRFLRFHADISSLRLNKNQQYIFLLILASCQIKTTMGQYENTYSWDILSH